MENRQIPALANKRCMSVSDDSNTKATGSSFNFPNNAQCYKIGVATNVFAFAKMKIWSVLESAGKEHSKRDLTQKVCERVNQHKNAVVLAKGDFVVV